LVILPFEALEGGVMSEDGIFSVVYLSEGTRSFSEQDLQQILTKARETNSKLGISGMLLFKGGKFLQVLEGDREKVMTLFDQIAQDPRHNRVTLCSRACPRSGTFQTGRWDFMTWTRLTPKNFLGSAIFSVPLSRLRILSMRAAPRDCCYSSRKKNCSDQRIAPSKERSKDGSFSEAF
jgi:hypothetical protein